MFDYALDANNIKEMLESVRVQLEIEEPLDVFIIRVHTRSLNALSSKKLAILREVYNSVVNMIGHDVNYKEYVMGKTSDVNMLMKCQNVIFDKYKILIPIVKTDVTDFKLSDFIEDCKKKLEVGIDEKFFDMKDNES